MFFCTLNLYDETNKKGLNITDQLTDENIEAIKQQILHGKINSLSIQNSDKNILNLETIAKLPKVQHLSVNSERVTYDGTCDEYFSDLKLFFLNSKKLVNFTTPEFVSLNYLGVFYNGLDYFKTTSSDYLWIGYYNLLDFIFDDSLLLSYLRLSTCRNLNGFKLSNLVNLRHFRCEWDSSNGDFRGLSKLKRLQAFSAFRVSKMTSLPDFSENINLEVVDIFQCNRLEDLSGLYNAPNLRILTIDESKKIRTEMIEPLVNHPTLEKILIRATVDEIRLQELFGNRWSRDLANMDYVLGEPRF